MEGDVWGSFAHDARDPTVAPLRASDADRRLEHKQAKELANGTDKKQREQ